MKQPEFVHLHNHSDLSLLDGASRVALIAARAKAYGQPAVALTDHGNMFAAIDFYEGCRANGVKPIVGIETYITAGRCSERSGDAANRHYHLILLARNIDGYHNLMRLSSRAYLEGFYYKPRIDHQMLAEHADGLIGLSACLRGEVPSHLQADRDEAAVTAALRYRDILGPGNFFLELQDHGLEIQQQLNRRMIELARQQDLPLVATNDCHYLDQPHSDAHDLLLCIQTGKSRSDPKRLKYSSDQLFIKSSAEMKELFAEQPEALANTLRIAERCELEIEFGKLQLPHFPLPAGFDSADAYLRQLSNAGLRGRYAEITPEIQERLDYELDIIRQLGYGGYFLIVHDFVQHAREKGVAVGPGRGSAAGSITSYALGITSIDPMRFGLIFERFLNPERVSMPDIDIDFCFERRGEIIEYVIEKYGEDCVSQIITFGTMAARAVLRDVGRALDLPYTEVDRIAKLVPPELGITLHKAIEQVPELAALPEKGEDYEKLLGASQTLEGLSRHASTHAAGVLITPRPLMDTVPLFKSSKGEVTTQYDMRSVEKIGLLKMDFLGLRTLTVIEKALALLRERHGVELTLETIDIEDAPTYELLARAETVGVFQLESGGMRDLLRRLQPECFEDIIAINALFRPGPLGSNMHLDYVARKHGQKKITYTVPELEPILRETYGTILYQEQVLRIASDLASLPLAQAEILRKAMGKKKPEEMARQRKTFVHGATQRGIAADKAEQIFSDIEYFAGYGFNKSHSAAYALISVGTAYLKTHYPIEFMAASMTTEMDSTNRIVILMDECRRMGIEVLTPDVNRSSIDFTVEDRAIRFGLGAVKNVGRGVIGELVEARTAEGEFEQLFDLSGRVSSGRFNRRVLESLIKAGACDELGGHRAQLLAAVGDAIAHGSRCARDRARGQESLFGDEGLAELTPLKLPDIEPWDQRTALEHEKELLGLYLSGHPLAELRVEIEAMSTCDTQVLHETGDGAQVRLVGLVAGLKRTQDRKGRNMAFATIEDFFGTVEVLVFANQFEEAGDDLTEDAVVAVEGRLSTRENEPPKIVAERLLGLERAREEFGGALEIKVERQELEGELLAALERVFAQHPGPGQVIFNIQGGGASGVKVLARKLSVGVSGELIRAVGTIVGGERVRLAARPRLPASAREAGGNGLH